MKHEEYSSFQLLASCEYGYISTCGCCHEYNFVYNNVLLRLEEDDLIGFCSWLIDSQNNPSNLFNLPNGRTRVYCSPISNLYLAFSTEELVDIADMFTQTKLVLEARKIAMHS